MANHQAQEILDGNATAALKSLEGTESRTERAIQERAHRIVKKREGNNVSVYIENQLEQIGSEAIDRVGELVQSSDERIATKNAHFVIEHIRGKAVQRNISVSAKLNIQSVLD